MQTEVPIPWVGIAPLPHNGAPHRRVGESFAGVPDASASQLAPCAENQFTGDGREILLQGFHWGSSATKSWYTILRDNAAAIQAAGFHWVWFPPSSDSLAPQGYIPRRWNMLDTAFGTEAELRAAIRALEPVKAMADLVLNHRVGLYTCGADFEDPPFPDNRSAITADDDSGVGTGSPDTGELYAAGRDLDHTNDGVRATVKGYLKRLKEVGFRGWRYDFVKGFHGKYVAEYNDASLPEFSVGEFWDGEPHKMSGWIDATGDKCTAFDFATRYRLFDACTRDDYHYLHSVNGGRAAPAGLLGHRPGRAVTFVDNHDTEYRRDPEHQHQNNDTRHFPGNLVSTAYAYLLTHPGIPCVFWSHYFDWGHETQQQIYALIKVRNAAGIHARSQVEIKHACRGLYAAIIDAKVAVKLGSSGWCPGAGWQLAVNGDKWAVWMRD